MNVLVTYLLPTLLGVVGGVGLYIFTRARDIASIVFGIGMAAISFVALVAWAVITDV